MIQSPIAPSLLAKLQACDTPTVCNAIEVVHGRRGFSAFTRGTMLRSDDGATPIVGFARTAKIAGTSPPDEPAATIQARRLDYFRSMAGGPRPALAVVEDTDYPDCFAAWWGEVHSAVHKGLGLSGALTNGVMRDLGDMEPGFSVIAGSIGPSHAFCHVVDIGTPVEVFGLSVAEGDLVHADRHGAVVIPTDVIDRLAAAIDKLRKTEDLILTPARQPDFNLAKLEAAWEAFEKVRT